MGIYFKAYVVDKNNHDWIIDIMKMECRCIQLGEIYKIKRSKIDRDINEIWKEILELSYMNDEGQMNLEDNKNKKIKIIPFPIIDYRKYIGQCALDLSIYKLSQMKANEPGAAVISIENKNDEKSDDEKSENKEIEIVNPNITKNDIEIERRNIFPKIGEKVMGKIVKIIRYGIFVDIGCDKNAF
eukprot:109751_1